MKVNTNFEAASPLLNRTALKSLQTHETKPNVPAFSILFNMFKSRAISAVPEVILRRNRLLGRPDPYYRLVTEVNQIGEKEYSLCANYDQHVVHPHGKYAYVVLSSSQGDYELRIGKMHHFYLASKSVEVLAAGEIDFWNIKEGPSTIIAINDHSGGYHINEEEDELVRSFKKLSISNVLESVGLPINKFRSVDNPKPTTSPRRHSL